MSIISTKKPVAKTNPSFDSNFTKCLIATEQRPKYTIAFSKPPIDIYLASLFVMSTLTPGCNLCLMQRLKMETDLSRVSPLTTISTTANRGGYLQAN